MRNATWDQRTVLQTHDPADGNRYVPVATLEGVSLPLDSSTALTIDGDRWHVVRYQSVVDTQARMVVTTVTVVKGDGVVVTVHAAPEEAQTRFSRLYLNRPIAI